MKRNPKVLGWVVVAPPNARDNVHRRLDTNHSFRRRRDAIKDAVELTR